MALSQILSTVYLDVYDHDTTPTTIKTIALDSQTRIVQAYLQKHGSEIYNPDPNATVELIAIRPDKVGVMASGSVVQLVEATEEDAAVYGLQAEITQAMIAVEGTVLFQFRITVGSEVLRTEIFRANNGRALDGETSSWADTYQGYNLDELVAKVDMMYANGSGIRVDGTTLKITSLDAMVTDYMAYVDAKIAEAMGPNSNT